MPDVSRIRNNSPMQRTIEQPSKPFILKQKASPEVEPQARAQTTAQHLSSLPSTRENVPSFGKMIACFGKILKETGKPVAQSERGSIVDARGSMIYIRDKTQPHILVSHDVNEGKTCFWDTSDMNSGKPKQLEGKDEIRGIKLMKKAAVSAAINPYRWTASELF
jgi:hypothetical protein